MKRCFVFLVALILGSQTIQAQVLKEGSLDILKGEMLVNFEVDYSKASIMNMTEKEFAVYEEDWNKDMPQIINDFCEGVMNASRGAIRLAKYPQATYTLRWEVLYIGLKGDTLSNIRVVDANGITKAVVTNIEGAGGPFGTKLYLIKIGAESSGVAFGRFLRKEYRK